MDFCYNYSSFKGIVKIVLKEQTMLNRIFNGLRSPKVFARLAGAILFLLGLMGYAFRSANSLPDVYLIGFLILGFWGIIVSFAP